MTILVGIERESVVIQEGGINCAQSKGTDVRYRQRSREKILAVNQEGKGNQFRFNIWGEIVSEKKKIDSDIDDVIHRGKSQVAIKWGKKKKGKRVFLKLLHIVSMANAQEERRYGRKGKKKENIRSCPVSGCMYF